MVEHQVDDLISKIIRQIISCEQLVILETNLGCVDGKIIGTGRADYTQGSTVYNLTIGNKTFALIDIPGIEGDESKYEEIISESLDKAHAIFYINGSGKKIEHATLDKVKKYMHDGTSVYAVFNVHCKAKKERIPGIDKTFEEELNDAYLKQGEIIRQTENELTSFLGSNYKGSLSLNGLLSFCGYAVEKSGKTTIVDERDKNLRNDQRKYIKEYSGEIKRLREDSHIELVREIIDDKVDNFESYIYTENIKKLKNRLSEMIIKIDNLKTVEKKKIKGFINVYNEFESNCFNAKEEYIDKIKHIGYNAAEIAFENVKDELFQMIEEDKGKTKPKKIQDYFNTHKNKIINDIQNSLNAGMEQSQRDYEEALEDARERLIKDFEREQTKFEISLSKKQMELDDSFAKALKYNFKTFKGDFFRVSSFAFSGGMVGSFFGPVGTIIGALAGALAGIISSVWNFFAKESTRINKAKEKLQREIDDIIDDVSSEIKTGLLKLHFEEKINDNYNQIYYQAEKQKEALKNVEKIMDNISKELKKNNKKIS